MGDDTATGHTTPVNLDKSPLARQAHALTQAIEESFPASEEATRCAVMASDLMRAVYDRDVEADTFRATLAVESGWMQHHLIGRQAAEKRVRELEAEVARLREERDEALSFGNAAEEEAERFHMAEWRLAALLTDACLVLRDHLEQRGIDPEGINTLTYAEKFLADRKTPPEWTGQATLRARAEAAEQARDEATTALKEGEAILRHIAGLIVQDDRGYSHVSLALIKAAREVVAVLDRAAGGTA